MFLVVNLSFIGESNKSIEYLLWNKAIKLKGMNGKIKSA